jgi:hypothetical protein
MCEFVSWIEKGNKVLFLTHDLIFNTDKGKKLQDWCRNGDDYTGHGAIRYYFGLEQDEGTCRECTNFSTPKNFPKVIVKAIKNGGMRGLGEPSHLLTKQAWAKYQKVRQPAWAEYEKAQQQAWAEYEKVERPAWAEYYKVRQPAWAEYEKAQQQAWAEYQKVEQQARAEYEKVQQQARAEYQKVEQQARAEYEKVRQPAFWDLFAILENRNPNWR